MDIKAINRNLNQQSGQATAEMVLLLVLGVGIMFGLFKGLKNMDYIGKMIVSPWSKISGMVECGTWEPCKPGLHPGNRVVTYRPKGQ